MNKILLVILIIFFVTVACGSEANTPTPNIEATVQAALAATQTAQATQVAAASPTHTATPEPVNTATATSTATTTPTPKPTHTPAPTATPTPTFTSTPSPTPFSKDNYAASANAKLNYREVNKSDRHAGEIACWKGKVFNIDEANGATFFQAYYFEGRHAADSDNAFVVTYNGVLPDVYEDTEVFVCGEIAEKFSGTNAFGGEISQPHIAAKFVDVWKPAPLPTAAPTNTPLPPTPLPTENSLGVQKQVGQWGMKLYNIKRAKAVYFFGKAEIAQGVWLIPMIEFTNLGTGTRNPWEDLNFYLVDDQNRQYEVTYNDGTAGARWQFQTGDIMDDINPGLVLGVSLPVDVPEALGNVWLRVEQDPNLAIYLGNAGAIPQE